MNSALCIAKERNFLPLPLWYNYNTKQERESEMKEYTKIPNELFTTEQITFKEKMLLFYLCMRAGSKKICFPSISRIAKELRISETTVISCIKALEQKGFIKKERRRNLNGGNSSNLYTIENDAY